MNAFAKIIAAAMLAGSLSIAAQAQPVAQVDISDLNLASAKDQKVLDLRINRAARAVCASAAVEQNPANIRAERECREATKLVVASQVQAKVGYATASR